MEQVKQELMVNGYVVIPNILNSDEIESVKSKFFDWKRQVNIDNFHDKMDPHYIYKYHEIGHQEHAWIIRTNPKIQNVFKYLWNTNDLVVSFDGCCYIPSECKKKDKCWTHTDQSSKKKGLFCYQGLVSLTANKERTLVVYEGSHLKHEEYFKDRFITDNKDWNLIDFDYLNSIKNTRRILNVPSGSLVLWDSRTFHQNQLGKSDEERLVQYVCYLPRSLSTQNNRIKRIKYFEERRTTSHWPCPVKVNAKQPRTFGNDSFKINYELLPVPNLDYMKEKIMDLI